MRAIVFLLTLILASMSSFYFFSRFEKITQKSKITPINNISFDSKFHLEGASDFITTWGESTLNWIESNKIGMLFGIWMATLLYYLMLHIYHRRQNKVVEGTFMGLLASGLLGLCVNCALPIAAANARKGRIGHFLKAIVIGSHALNLLVLFIIFKLLPLDFAVIKILHVFFIIAVTTLYDTAPSARVETTIEHIPNPPSLKLLPVIFLKNILTFVPLMVLGGMIANLIFLKIPPSFIATTQPTILDLSVSSLFFSLLPVPLTFDIVFTSNLVGIHANKALTLTALLSLGPTSLLIFFILRGKISWKNLVKYHALVVISTIAISAAYMLYDKLSNNSALGKLEAIGKRLGPESSPWRGRSDPNVNLRSANSCRLEKPKLQRSDDAWWSLTKLCSSTNQAPGFVRLESSQLGLHSAEKQIFSPWPNILSDYYSLAGALAAEDFNQDGWIDLLVNINNKLLLFKNNHGVFEQIELTDLSPSVGLALFMDVNADELIDILISDDENEHLFVINQNPDSSFSKPVTLNTTWRKSAKSFVTSIAIGDIDQDRQPEIVLGLGVLQDNYLHSHPSASNVILFKEGDTWVPRSMEQEDPGETLSILLTDLEGNGRPQLWFGNDYNVPDYIYNSSGKGSRLALRQFNKDLIPITTRSTMSVSSADFDNDLQLEVFSTDMKNPYTASAGNFCLSHGNAQQRRICHGYTKALSTANAGGGECLMANEGFRESCFITAAINLAETRRDIRFCLLLRAKFLSFFQPCLKRATRPIEHTLIYFPPSTAIPQISKNILLKKQSDGKYQDIAAAAGIESSFWSWNTLIYDFDNDGLQDIHIVNGFMYQDHPTPHVAFKNRGNLKFKEVQAEWGLNSTAKSFTSLAFDFNNDGAMDIFEGSALAGIVVMKNQHQGNSLQIDLTDWKPNQSCLGCKVVIKTGSTTQLREVKIGGGFRSFNPPRIHFGLGDHEVIDELKVVWSDGVESKLFNLNVDRHLLRVSRAELNLNSPGSP